MTSPSIKPLRSGHFAALDEEGQAWLSFMEWISSDTRHFNRCAGVELVKLSDVTNLMDHVTDPALVVMHIDSYQEGEWSKEHFPDLSALGNELLPLLKGGLNEQTSWTEQPSEDQQQRARKILQVLADDILASARIEAKIMSEGHCLFMDNHHYYECNDKEDASSCGLDHEWIESKRPNDWKDPIFQPNHLYYLYSKKVWTIPPAGETAGKARHS